MRSIIEPIDTPNNKLYIKHSYNKGDEKKARIDHGSAHALLEGKERKKNKTQKRSWHDSFFFFVRDSLSKFVYVQYREGTSEQRRCCAKKGKRLDGNKKVSALCLHKHIQIHYLMTRK